MAFATGNSAVADPTAREFLRRADPVLRKLLDARPDFRPRAWLNELPPRDAFGTLIFEVVGQQLSVRATRVIVSRLEERFGGHLPSPQELFAVDPHELPCSPATSRCDTPSSGPTTLTTCQPRTR
jgi:3-methyladenine DNA glycosylase/8-oxoguanine DNA glycosylase